MIIIFYIKFYYFILKFVSEAKLFYFFIYSKITFYEFPICSTVGVVMQGTESYAGIAPAVRYEL